MRKRTFVESVLRSIVICSIASFCVVLLLTSVVLFVRQCTKLPSVLVLNLVCNGAGPTAVIRAHREQNTDLKSIKYSSHAAKKNGNRVCSDYLEFTRLHASALENDVCFVVAMGEDTELVLAPVRNSSGNGVCVFWAYAAMRGAVAHVTEMIQTSRIPLVFDLDETLVLAQTIYSLRNRSAQLGPELAAINSEGLMNAETAEKLRLLQQEEKVLAEDMAQLTSFMERDRIEVNGDVIHASHECVSGDEGHDFLRPVVRLSGKVFTRIDPKRNDTSMIIRIREGWEELSGYLRGEDTADKRQRFKIWVCTAAERGYALEAWRLLDETGELIPKDEIRKRLICAGKQRKSLFRTFSLGPFSEEPLPVKILYPTKKLSPLCDGHSEMAMAVIADDRLDVWEKRSQEQIMKITPYTYPCIETQTPSEIQKMLTTFQSVRSQFYFELLEQTTPAVRDLCAAGLDQEVLRTQVQERMKGVASVAQFLSTVAPNSVPAVLSEPMSLPEASLKPNDRRVITESPPKRVENGRVSRLPLVPSRKRNAKRQKRAALATQLASFGEPHQAPEITPPPISQPVMEPPVQRDLREQMRMTEGPLERQFKEQEDTNGTVAVASRHSLPTFSLPPPVTDAMMAIPGLMNIGEVSLQTPKEDTQPQIQPSSNPLNMMHNTVMLAPQLPAPGEAPLSRYVIARHLPDGRFIVQPVPPGDQPPGPSVQPQIQMDYALQSASATTPTPLMAQMNPWVSNWVPQQLHTPVQSHQITGSYARQVNIPSQVLDASQGTNQQSGIQPHQLEVSGVRILSSGTPARPTNTTVDSLLTAAVSAPPSQNLQSEPRLEYASLPSSEPQQLFLPFHHPPPPPPDPPGLQRGTPSRANRERQRLGFHSRGVGKRTKGEPGSDQRAARRGNQAARRGRGAASNNRRLQQKKGQNAKSLTPPSKKKQKQVAADNEAVQDFDMMKYMEQLEDELEEDGSEEGEIRSVAR